jgi:NAD(P)-dependent dehydrogenase (short-subunit alcohol dehydrogenase family)
MSLQGKTILITGGARRVGRAMTLAAAKAGANVIIHHSGPAEAAEETAEAVRGMGAQAWVLQADFRQPEAVEGLIARANALSKLYALVNNAAIFEDLGLKETGLETWQRHMNINLTAPFLLSRDFGAQMPAGQPGRIVNIVDWRALRPAADHFAYTISKAGLVALTLSNAAALAPNITVNGLALGAILPPNDGPRDDALLGNAPIHRWAKLEEVGEALLFLLDGSDYITGEVIYLDGGRHLV